MAYVTEIGPGYFGFNTEGVTVSRETYDRINTAFERAKEITAERTQQNASTDAP